MGPMRVPFAGATCRATKGAMPGGRRVLASAVSSPATWGMSYNDLVSENEITDRRTSFLLCRGKRQTDNGGDLQATHFSQFLFLLRFDTNIIMAAENPSDALLLRENNKYINNCASTEDETSAH